MLVISEQRTLSQNGVGELQLPDGRQVNSGAPIKELLLWHEKWTLTPIFVFLVDATNPLRSTIAGQWTGWTIISTLCWWRVGVVHVNVPESSFCAWKILSRYSSVRSRPSSSVHPSGYFLHKRKKLLNLKTQSLMGTCAISFWFFNSKTFLFDMTTMDGLSILPVFHGQLIFVKFSKRCIFFKLGGDKYIPVLMRNFPFRGAKSPYPKTFHVNNCARVDDKSAVVTLCDGT